MGSQTAKKAFFHDLLDLGRGFPDLIGGDKKFDGGDPPLNFQKSRGGLGGVTANFQNLGGGRGP